MINLKNKMAPQELLLTGAALQSGIFDALHEKPAKLDELVSKLSMDFRALDSRAAWNLTQEIKNLIN